MSRFGRRLLATWSAKGGRSSARPTASRGWRPSAVDRSTSSRSEEHTSELQSRSDLVCRLLLEKKKKINTTTMTTIHSINIIPTSQYTGHRKTLEANQTSYEFSSCLKRTIALTRNTITIVRAI